MKLLRTLLIGVALMGSTALSGQSIFGFTDRQDSIVVDIPTMCLTIHLSDNDSYNANISMELDGICWDDFQLLGYSYRFPGVTVVIYRAGDAYFLTELTNLWGY